MLYTGLAEEAGADVLVDVETLPERRLEVRYISLCLSLSGPRRQSIGSS